MEDFAAFILGWLQLYQTDFDTAWLAAAKQLADEILEELADSASGFFDTPNNAAALLLRPQDLQHGAIRSGNSMAVEALMMLEDLTGESVPQCCG